MPEKDDRASKVKESEIVLGAVFVADDQPAEVVQPGKEAFDLPSFAVAAQAATVVERRFASTTSVRRQQDHLPIQQDLAQRVAVVGFVANQTQWHFLDQRALQGRFHQRHFRGRSSLCVDGERKTMSISDCHDFDTLAALGFANRRAPFLAAEKLPSMKHSERSNPPRS